VEEVLSLRDLGADEMTTLARHYRLTFAVDPHERWAWLQEHGRRVRAVITNGRTGLSAPEMALMPQLGIICLSGAGYEQVDMATARQRGILVTNSAGANAASVADHAFALMGAVARKITTLDRLVRAGGSSDAETRPDQIAGRVIGILGLGHIGREIAARAGGFGMPIHYFNRGTAEGVPYERADSLAALAEVSDFLVISAPGGPSTRGLIDADVLRRLGPDGYLVNVGRGSIVVTEDLIAALHTGTIAGAALDVVDGEPVVPAELRALDNVVLTPHVGGRSPESSIRRMDQVIRNLDAFFRDGSCVTPVTG
jgi:lactate dehydrogenase-like 2-hydroxyacid dehydrogenase